MKDKKQTSDSAQKGPGVTRFKPSTKESTASRLGGLSSGTNPSGQPNPTGSRGKG